MRTIFLKEKKHYWRFSLLNKHVEDALSLVAAIVVLLPSHLTRARPSIPFANYPID